MPTRILREGILTSPRVNKLEAHEELFYRRIMSVVDDYGRYFAHPALLRAACYPFQLDRVKEDSISKHLAACVDARLIFPYTVNGTAYLQLLDFRQQERGKSKFPEPDKQLLSECEASANQAESGCEANAPVVGVEVGVEDEIKTRAKKPRSVSVKNRKTSIPDDFGQNWSPAMQKWLEGKEQVKAHLIHFAGYAKANGKQYADWEQAFQNAIREDWAGIRKAGL